MRFPRASFVALLALACAAAAAAAEKEAKPPVFGTEISLVSVPVFVVDKDGRAMRGLAADDFELAEDGKPSRIVSFQYIDTTEAVESEAVQQSPDSQHPSLPQHVLSSHVT